LADVADPIRGRGVAIEHILEELAEGNWLDHFQRYYYMADEWAALRALLPDDGKAVTPGDRVVEERMETIWKEQQKAATVMQKGAGVPEVSEGLEIIRRLLRMA